MSRSPARTRTSQDFFPSSRAYPPLVTRGGRSTHLRTSYVSVKHVLLLLLVVAVFTALSKKANPNEKRKTSRSDFLLFS